MSIKIISTGNRKGSVYSYWELNKGKTTIFPFDYFHYCSDGNAHESQDWVYDGKDTLVHSFKCPFCKITIPKMIQLALKLKTINRWTPAVDE